MKTQTIARSSINNVHFHPQDKSNRMLEKIMNSSLDVICTLDRMGVFTKINAASFKMWGYLPEQLVGSQSMELVIPADRQFTKRAFAQIRSGTEMTNFENHFICKDGSLIPLVWSARWDEEDQTMYCIARDAREKLQFEQELRDNQKRLNKVQQMAKLAGWEFDLVNKRTHWVSDEMYTILGIDRDEHPVILSQVFRSLVHPDDLEKVAAAFNNKEQLDNYLMEHRILRTNGQVVYIRQSMELVYEKGIPVRLTGVVQDITDQKIADQLLISSERRYRSLVHNGFDMISILDADGNYLYVSESTYRILGYESKDLLGLNAFDLMHPDDVVRVAKSFARLYTETYVEDTLPYRFKNKKGEWRWLGSKGANMLHDRAINGLVINSHDITDKRIMQDKFEKQIKEWQKKINKASIQAQEQERSQLGRELHDNVNQVLTTVKLYAELCLDGHQDQHLLLEKSTGYLTECINEIRSISRRLSTPTLGDISFEDSIKELVGSLKLTDKININLTVDKPLKKMAEDVHLGVYRIIQEHMTNVLKHAQASNVEIAIKLTLEEVIVTIKDDGKGFNVKSQRQGIGITNMHGRTESLNGKLKFKSSPEKGCLLHLTIPLQESTVDN